MANGIGRFSNFLRGRGRIAVGIRVLAALAIVATAVTLSQSQQPRPAAADTPFTVLNETFNEGGTFPPANWSVGGGTWSFGCPAASPATGCSAVASFSGNNPGLDELLYNPASGIPSNVQNLTLSFYSDYSPDGTAASEIVNVGQASVPGDSGDFSQLVSIAGGPTGGDPTGTQVQHTVSLPNTNLPIAFRWSSSGASNETWAISNVTITGTVPSTSYSLTANPINNTVYPHIVGGTPVTIALSGSSNPTGDSLEFAIDSPPSDGSLSPITQVDATDATVVYTPRLDSCEDQNGTPGFICSDTFTFTVHDAEGNVSSPAEVDLQILPGGAGGVVPVVNAPLTESYTTLSQNGNLVQGADLTGAVTVGPSDFPDEIQLHLIASTGTIDLINGVASGVTFINGTANNESQIYITGSVTKLNTALDEFLYFPPSGTTPTATIGMQPVDMGPTGSGPFTTGTEVTTTINGIVTNPPPSIAMPTGTLSIPTDAGPLTFPSGASTGITLTDDGASATTQDEVTLSVSGGTLALPASDTGGPTQLVTAQSLSGGAILDITGTVININEALHDLTFDPTNLPSETVTLTASAQDPDTQLSSAQESVPITVIEAPFAFGATSFSTLEGTPATVWLCGAGPSGDTLTFTITTEPTNGTLVGDPSANPATSGCSPSNNAEAFVYTPASGYTGPDSFVYTVTDPTTGLESMDNTVAITVNAHTQPTAYNVSAITTEDHPVTVVLCGENPENNASTLAFDIVQAPADGTLTDAGAPSVNTCSQGNVAEDYTYTPSPGTFTTSGSDTFTYEVTNGTFSAPATGTINVTTLTPAVAGYSVGVNEDSSIGLNLCATDPDVNAGDTFSIVQPSHGTLDQMVAPTNGPSCPSGYFNFGYERYVPNQLYSGPDQIGFTASAGGYTSTEGFIDITVQKVEIPPTANPQTVTDIVPQPVDITLTGSSLQGSPLTYDVTSDPQHGTLTGTAPNLVYTPSSSNPPATDSFTFVTNDGVADSAAATVTIDFVVPQLSSSVCYAGTPIDAGNSEFNCAGPLTSVSSPEFGAIELAHTSGVPDAELQLQQTVTNESTASDTVTLTAPAGTAQWPYFYDVQGADDTAQITGSGLQVTLGPVGSGTNSVDVQIIVFAPLTLPAPAVVSTHVLAVSGNSPSVSTQVPIEVQDGTSTPTLALAQANGSGGVSFPTSLAVSPPLYDDGPAGAVDIEAGLSGTGINTFSIHATVQPGSTPGVTPTFLLGTTNVTAAVLAGTEVITCYAAPVGCPPMSAQLTPGSGSGNFSMEVTIQSTIDGQGTQDFATAQLAGSVGPDLWTTLPNVGTGVFETTPVTQIVSQATEVSGSATRTVYLQNDGTVSDTFTVQAAVTLASGDSSVISVGATAPGFYGDLGAATNVTPSITGAGYDVTIPAGDVIGLNVTDAAGSTASSAPPQVILTATSQLDPAKVDSFEVKFPTYDYRPDAILTGPDGSQIGAGVYQQTYLGPVGNNQQAEYDVDQGHVTNIDVALTDRGTGPQPAGDSVVVTAPNVDSNFDVTYTLLQNGTSTDVTSALTGPGLPLTLYPGAAMPVIQMNAQASVTAQAGHPGYFPLTVSSQSSLPAGLADVVVIGLYNQGQSQLRFAGLPQPEPSDITTTVAQDGETNRVAPLPDDGYTPGVTYGAYSDPTGNKFAYVSGYDTFDLQVASEIVTPTAYRIQMVDPGSQLTGLPAWERDAFGQPYYNGGTPVLPADGLAAGSGLNIDVTAGGQDITSAVANGTYTTGSLGTNATSDITVSFNPTTQQRYIPIKFNLYDATTGELEDVMVVEPSSIVTCTPDGDQQVQQSITTASGTHKLNFEAYNRVDPQSPSACMQHLSHSWITTAPLVFGQYVPATSPTQANGFNASPAGGDNPMGLWLMPQPNTILKVDTDTGVVTGNATAFVDSPYTDANGIPQASTASDGLGNYYFLGMYTSLNWNTTDGTNGLAVASNAGLPPAPFPLVKPSDADWPSNTMGAGRYFQVDGLTGAPVMVGEMDVDVPWFSGDVPLTMEVDSADGLQLKYAAPQNTEATVPISNSSTSLSFYLMYWNETTDGKVTQGGCLGLPASTYTWLSDVIGTPDLGPQICLLDAIVTFAPVNPTPGAPTGVSQISILIDNLYQKSIKQNPEFNLNSFSGEIDMDPTNGEQVQKVVLDPNFGVGPPTPCQLTQNNGEAEGILNTLLYAPCPSNFFFYNAKFTYQAGGFDTGYSSPGGIGLQASGTLTFLNVIQLANIEADISTSPFNFHFADSPIDLSISNSIPVSAQLTFSGDVGAAGFDIDVSGAIVVDGVDIAGASGVLSTKGMGVCGTLAGISIGFGYPWGGSPTVYPSGCTTNQFVVGT